MGRLPVLVKPWYTALNERWASTPNGGDLRTAPFHLIDIGVPSSPGPRWLREIASALRAELLSSL